MTKTKKCSNCKIRKTFQAFYCCKHTLDGLQSQCKSCIKASSKRFQKNNKDIIYKRRKIFDRGYPWVEHYYGLRKRCNNTKHPDYKRYGGKGVRAIITKKEVKYLWFRDKAYTMDKPSIDRKRSQGNYTLKNCQFIEMLENSKKGSQLTIKPIIQYNLNGCRLQVWESIREALRGIGAPEKSGNISLCAKGRAKTSLWFYLEI